MSGALAAALRPGALRPGLADAAALSALVRESVAGEVPRQVLLLRLAPITAGLQAEHHQRLLRDTLEPLLRPSRARLYALPNGDLVAVGPEHGWHLQGVADRLRILLGDHGPPGSEPPGALLRLPEQATVVLAAVEAALAEEPDPAPPTYPVPLPRRRPDGAPPPPPDPARLAQVLAGANLAAFLRCRPVLRLLPGGETPAEPVWTEWRVALPELAAALLGGAAADPPEALLRTPPLRSLLDQRLLAELAQPAEALHRGPLGLALDLPALDSAPFRRLDSVLAPATRGASVLGLPAEAVLADPTGFLAAREVLAARGWRLALDVADPGLLGLLPPARLGVALVRLAWTPGLAAAGLPPVAAPERVVLTGVDRAAALGWGLEAGIRLFEGRLLAR